MKFTVEPWAPEYGVSASGEEALSPPDVDIELPAAQWHPLLPDVDPVAAVLFIDGVRRVDANIWIGGEAPALGLCAVYAAGAVLCDGRAEVIETKVERGVFTSAPGADDVVTSHVRYPVRGTAGNTPEELWLGIQERMGALEGELASRQEAELVVLDGPLSGRRHVEGAIGYIKAQHVQYLPDHLHQLLGHLPTGRRTPLFLTTTAWSRYSWYLRLAVGPGPYSGIVRCEVSADRSVAEAARIADRVTATLPRFASAPHKDPRAPQNLYPIGGLERALRRLLGDPQLMYRSLKAAAAG